MSYNIRKYRKAVGMTQADLAKKLGVNRATVSKYESGEIDPPASQIRAIGKILNVPVSNIVGDDIHEFLHKLAHEDERFTLRVYINPEQDILSALDKLNATGKSVAVERVEELTEIPRYQKKADD